MSALGAFVAWLAGWTAKQPTQRIKEQTFHAGFVAFGVAFLAWLVELATDRL